MVRYSHEKTALPIWKSFPISTHLYCQCVFTTDSTCHAHWPTVKCGSADMHMFEHVKCRQILRIWRVKCRGANVENQYRYVCCRIRLDRLLYCCTLWYRMQPVCDSQVRYTLMHPPPPPPPPPRLSLNNIINVVVDVVVEQLAFRHRSLWPKYIL